MSNSFSRDSVLAWFNDRLEPHDRIELLCSLLLSCAPLELRFLAAWSEAASAAGANAIELREAEARVNSPAELLRLAQPEGDDSAVSDAALCRLTLALTLVRPDNSACGRLLSSWLARLDLDRVDADAGGLRHACLVGALAVHQPALPFACRLRMLPVQRRLADQLAGQNLEAQQLPHGVAAAAAAAAAPRLRSRSATGDASWLGGIPPLPPTVSSPQQQYWRHRRLSDATELDAEAHRPPDSGPKKQRTGIAAPGLCFKHASLVASNRRQEEGRPAVGLETPFCIQATLWPGGVRSEIVRSLADLLALYAKIQPKLQQQAASVPLLDSLLNCGRSSSGLNAETATNAVQILLRAIAELPEAARRSADILEFFSSRRPPRPPQPPPSPPTAAAASTVAHSRARSDSGLATAAKSGLMLQFQSLTVGSVGYATDGAVYAACHYGQDYQSKLLTWLKTHRMHKYFERLRKYSFEQLLAIDRPTLEALEFTQGAIKKLLGMLERVRQDRQAFDCPSRSSGSPCSSGACSEEEIQMHGLGRPPLQHPLQQQQQQQMMLRKQPMVHQQHRLMGPLPLSLQPLPPPPPPPPPHLQHSQHPQHPQHPHQQQQQQQPFRYTSVSRAGGSCGSPA